MVINYLLIVLDFSEKSVPSLACKILDIFYDDFKLIRELSGNSLHRKFAMISITVNFADLADHKFVAVLLSTNSIKTSAKLGSNCVPEHLLISSIACLTLIGVFL